MKRLLVTGIGTSFLLMIASFTTHLPGLVNGEQYNSASAQNPQQQQALKLNLVAEKQVLLKDEQGKKKAIWQTLKQQAVVQPGDILRYTLTGENRSDRPIKNLTLNQPIPQGMVYVLKSANFTSGAKISYSINGGSSFVENPTIQVTVANGQVATKPAPASIYTHIRLSVPILAARTTIKATYQTQVR